MVGADDVTDPDARNETDNPIHGMPILSVDESASTIVPKRSMSPGYAGIDTPLFTDPKTSMRSGDAEASVEGITEELEALWRRCGPRPVRLGQGRHGLRRAPTRAGAVPAPQSELAGGPCAARRRPGT